MFRGALEVQSGKLHFGVILGWNVVASAAVWFVVNHLAALDGPHSQGLGGYDCCCLLGYCQVPLLIYALLALIIPRYASPSHRTSQLRAYLWPSSQ